MTNVNDLKVLGKSGATFNGLETFDAPPAMMEVQFTCDEVTAVCPVTGQPDQYTVNVTVVSPVKCIESKSLKLYFHQFRNQGIFCEAFASKIAFDIAEATQSAVAVEVVQKSRGGISIRAEVYVPRQETEQ